MRLGHSGNEPIESVAGQWSPFGIQRTFARTGLRIPHYSEFGIDCEEDAIDCVPELETRKHYCERALGALQLVLGLDLCVEKSLGLPIALHSLVLNGRVIEPQRDRRHDKCPCGGGAPG